MFSNWAIKKAEIRQDKKDGLGVWCAMCKTNIGLAKEHAIPRVPIAKNGTYKHDNCIIVCEKCFDETGANHAEEIPYSKLPYYRV